VTPRRRAAVAPAAPVPTWLDPQSVKAWLRVTDPADDPLIEACCAAVEPFVQRARPDQYDTAEPPLFVPDGEVYQAAVMLAARTYRRRNSPGGIESIADAVTYVARYDPEIERALRAGSWRMPGVG
jgi:Phage gp6-like head-tail connector protein